MDTQRFQGKVAVVTGGAGFIGSYIVDALLKEGASVRVIDNLSTSDGSNIHKEAEFSKLSIATDDLSGVLGGADYIFHTGAIPRTQYCVEHPVESHQVNAYGSLRLLEESKTHAPDLRKFIYSSSCAIYGPQEEMPITEDAPLNHGTPYALQKLIGEQYTRMFAQLYNMPTIALRYANVYGTKRQSEKGGYPNVLAAFSRQKRELGKLQITGDGTQSRDFVHVFDVVEANLMAALSGIRDGSAFNVSTGYGTTLNEIAKYYGCPIDYIPARPGEARHLTLDATKTMKKLGWQAQISLDEGMHIYLNG
jgi:UDP-glucose 4-epimerase